VRVVIVQYAQKQAAAGDPGLTALGVRQTAALSAYLSHFHWGLFMSSPLRRARETARPLAAALGLPVHFDSRLGERMNWLEDDYPEFGDFLVEWTWVSADRAYVPRAGESSQAKGRRMLDAMADYRRAAVDTLVVSHGGCHD
jgi:2,3-bisphosphoglycerate-dependent phosphoglycerate mutase